MDHSSCKFKRSYAKKIFEISISDSIEWKKNYLDIIFKCYYNMPYFKEYFNILTNIILKSDYSLTKLNIELIRFFLSILKISTPMLFSSQLACKGNSSELLYNLCKKVNAKVYLSGICGKIYLNENLFSNGNIIVKYNEFFHPIYPSQHSILQLSSLDLVMRHGNQAYKYIKI